MMNNRSGTITSGGVSQTFAAATSPAQPRKGWSVQNTSAGNLYVNDIGSAASTSDGLSYLIVPGAMLAVNPQGINSVSQSAINIIGATTGQTFVGREW